MSSSNTSAVPDKSPEKKRRYLSAEKKFQIYLEAQDGGKPVGELLRREGLFSTDLARIRQPVKEGALQRLSAKPGCQQGHVSTEVHEAISYLMTGQKGEYLYLYLLLAGGLTDQSILDLPEDQRPEVINDRGRQMKAKPIQRLCEDHGMPQLFARPRTPNDNPFIESAFSTVKRAPEHPGRFLDDDQAIAYFKGYFAWYDTEHYHSGIDGVTPQQAHDGQRQIIVDQRRTKKLAQRRRRREANQKQKTGPRKTNNQNITMPAFRVA